MSPEPTAPTNQIAGECDTGSPFGSGGSRIPVEGQVPAGERRSASIRFRLASLVVACVLPVWIAAGFLLYYNFRSRRALTEQRMLETARALTMVVDRELSNMQAGLSVLATSGSLDSGDLSAFYRQAHTVQQAHPGSNIILSDPTGQELVNLNLPFGAPLHERSAPDAVRQVYATGRPFVTSIYKGGVTGRLNVSVDVPVFRDGRVVYDLAMVLPTDHIAAILPQQHLPPEWIGTIIGNDNAVVARTRSPEQFVGKNAPPTLLRYMAKAAEGMAEIPNHEGTPLFNSFSRAAVSGWTVVIGVPKALLMAETWRWLWLTMAGTALLSLTGIALALPIGRNVEKSEIASRRLSVMVESSDDAIIGYRLDGIVESWNRGAERLFGYSAPEIVGRHISILVPDDQLEGFSDRMQRVRNGEVVEQYETTRKHKNGLPIPVSLKISPIFAALGMVVGASAIVRDIAERKRSEQALAESEERLRTIVELAPDGIFVINDQGQILEVNQAACKQLGYNRGQLRELAIFDIVAPQFAKRVAARLRGEVLSGSYESAHIRADGVEIPVELSATKIMFRGQPAFIEITRDISDRKRADEALRRSEAGLATAQRIAHIGSWEWDIQSDTLRWSEETFRLYDFAPVQQEERRKVLDRIHPADRERVEKAQSDALSGNQEYELEYRICLPDGSEKLVHSQAEVLRNKDGVPVLMQGVVQDITERKRAEEQRKELEQQLRQAQKMEAVGRLAGGIAHDFNNLLMVIQGYTTLLQRSLPEGTHLRKNTHEIMKAAERAAKLTGQMLAFSRKQILSPVVLDLNVVIEETAQMLKRLIGEDIDFRVSPAEALWSIEADSDQMVQILMNLCVNARDAMPQGGTLTIATGNVTVEKGGIDGHPYVLPGDYVKLSVTDTGMGISKDMQEQIFEPFFTTKEVGKGTGLGLAMVYGVVKQSGGNVWVDSEPEQGACFTIYLPRAKGAIAPDIPAEAEALPAGKGTLLVAEDEGSLRELMCGHLGGLGYTVLEAGSGQQALSVASQHEGHIDLLITDLVMPKIGGRELSRMLENLRPDLKTIYISGYTDDVVLRHGISELGETFLQKPFSLDTLARKVRDALGQTETMP